MRCHGCCRSVRWLPGLPLEPRFGALAVAAAVQDDEGVELVQPDGRHLERVLLLDTPGRRLPLALNDRTVRPPLRVVEQEVDTATLAVDIAPDGALLREDGLARGDETGQAARAGARQRGGGAGAGAGAFEGGAPVSVCGLAKNRQRIALLLVLADLMIGERHLAAA